MKAFYPLLFLLLFSCRKNYQKVQPVVNEDPDNLTEQLTGTWALYAQTSNSEKDWDGDGISETNIYGTFTDCQKEAGLIFLPNNEGTIKISCNENKNIRWRITNSSNDLNIITNGVVDPKTYKIIQLNKYVFITSTAVLDVSGNHYLIVSRYLRR